KAIKQAAKLAKVAAPSVKEKITLADVKSHKDSVMSPRIKSLNDITVTDKINMIKEAEKVYKDYGEVKSYNLGYDEIIDHRR
ncbi:MAG: TldD/PmbA family protein, partial [Candidatus Heimdallarchaeota archaeon]